MRRPANWKEEVREWITVLVFLGVLVFLLMALKSYLELGANVGISSGD